MSGQNNVLKKTREPKPKIQDIALNHLEEDNLANFLNFLEFLQSIKLTARWHAHNSWSVNHKGKTICYIQLRKERSWTIQHNGLLFEEYDRYILDDELKKFVWNNMRSPICAPNCYGRSMMVMGKKIDTVCYCWPFLQDNMNGAALEHLKNIIEVRKNIIADNHAK
ncbi:MAG: hypothetical protein FWE06_09575 [Oscillospiraceae bacterium]|nr:hypothetical protein [Oscillospiraceae bacterium]